FDAVVVCTGICTGNYNKPFVPPIPGLLERAKKWPDRFTHSSKYRDNTFYRNKTILIVGGGVFAFDFGKEIALVAEKVYRTLRPRQNNDRSAREKLIERFVWSTVPDNVIQPEGIEHIHAAIIILADGSFRIGIDYIIFCTGYVPSLPFLSAYHTDRNDEKYPRDPVFKPIIGDDSKQLHSLHLDMFFIPTPTLAFIGVPYDIATFPLFDLQSIALAAVFSGKVSFPDHQRMSKAYEKRKLVYGPRMAFHRLRYEKDLAYIKEIVSWVNSSHDDEFIHGYEELLLEALGKDLEIFRVRLLATVKISG
ncbi:hypothetical protein BDD12DRAFT_749629, partial [Trichophaea hybrida]